MPSLIPHKLFESKNRLKVFHAYCHQILNPPRASQKHSTSDLFSNSPQKSQTRTTTGAKSELLFLWSTNKQLSKKFQTIESPCTAERNSFVTRIDDHLCGGDNVGDRLKRSLHTLGQRDDDRHSATLSPEASDLLGYRAYLCGRESVDNNIDIPDSLLQVGYHLKRTGRSIDHVDVESIS